MGVKERLILFIEYKKLSQGKFEKKIGLSNGYVNSIGNSINGNYLDKISNVFPELSKCWLIFNEGEMLRDEKKAQTYSTDLNVPIIANEQKITPINYEGMKFKIQCLEEILSKKDAEIARLNQEIGAFRHHLGGKKGEAHCG